jgi:hypothetical protein
MTMSLPFGHGISDISENFTPLPYEHVFLPYPVYLHSGSIAVRPLYSLSVGGNREKRHQCSSDRLVRVQDATRCRTLGSSPRAQLKSCTFSDILPTG